MESLNVAFFCWESLYAERVGGLASAATRLAEALAKNHNVHFFTRGWMQDQEINGVWYHYCQPQGNNTVQYCENMSNQMVDQFQQSDPQEKFDILHFHDWHPIPALHRLRTGTPSSRSIPQNTAGMATSMVTGGSIKRSPARNGTGASSQRR